MTHYQFETQHNGELTTVIIGWDKFIKGFSMIIKKESDTKTPFWSHFLHGKITYPHTLTHFLEVLQGFGIALPRHIIDALMKDKDNNHTEIASF